MGERKRSRPSGNAVALGEARNERVAGSLQRAERIAVTHVLARSLSLSLLREPSAASLSLSFSSSPSHLSADRPSYETHAASSSTVFPLFERALDVH